LVRAAGADMEGAGAATAGGWFIIIMGGGMPHGPWEKLGGGIPKGGGPEKEAGLNEENPPLPGSMPLLGAASVPVIKTLL
jgi:hypothetical protein